VLIKKLDMTKNITSDNEATIRTAQMHTYGTRQQQRSFNITINIEIQLKQKQDI